MVQRNTETVQQVWESGSKMAGQLTERSMERFARAFGMTGEGAQQATEQSSRNLECIVQSGTIFAGGLQSISREWFDLPASASSRICIASMIWRPGARRRR
jgi:hypothetical protein